MTLIYEDKKSTTLQEALIKHTTVPHRILKYHQRMTLHPTMNATQSPLYRCNGELIEVYFPPEYAAIGHIQNDAGCKMVIYVKEGYLTSQVIVTKKLQFDLLYHKNQSLIIYHAGVKPIQLQYDVYLVKGNLPSKL